MTRRIIAGFDNGRGYVFFHFDLRIVHVLPGNTGRQAAAFGQYFLFVVVSFPSGGGNSAAQAKLTFAFFSNGSAVNCQRATAKFPCW